MFGWISTIIGYLLSPIYSALYNTLVLGALNILNMTFQAFEYFAGSNTSELLFNTSIVDGNTQFNFFQSDSVLKPIFMTLLIFSCCLFAVFVPISIMTSMGSLDKNVRLKKIKSIIGATTGVFFVPVAFLTILSLTGGLINILSGKRIAMSNNDIGVYQTKLKNQVKKFRDYRQSFLSGIDSKQKITILDLNGKKQNYSISEIYKNMTNHEQWKFDTEEGNNDPISELSKKNKQALYDVNKMVKQSAYESNLKKIEDIIKNLKPNQKDQSKADNIKTIIAYFSGINNKIHNFVRTGNEILLNYEDLKVDTNGNLKPLVDANGEIIRNSKTQQPLYPEDKKSFAIYNFKQAFDKLYGIDDPNLFQSKTYDKITNMQSFLTESNSLIDGSISGINPSQIKQSAISGLEPLRHRLADIEDNSLVVILYQLTSGNNDSLWYEAKWITEPPQFLIIGAAIIAFAIILMFQNILFAAVRLLNLAVLFIMSPPAIMSSPIDNGEIFKKWLKMVCSNLVSILGIVITLKVFGLLYTGWKDSLTANSKFGQSASLINTFLLAMFGLGGIMAAKQAGTMFSTVFGLGERMNASETMAEAGNILRTAGKGAMMAGGALFGKKGLSQSSWSKNPRGFGSIGGSVAGKGGNKPPQLFRQKVRQGLGSALTRVTNPIVKPLTKMSKGKIGTMESKRNWADGRERLARHKEQVMTNKVHKAQGKWMNSLFKDSPKKEDRLWNKLDKLKNKQAKSTKQVASFKELKKEFTPPKTPTEIKEQREKDKK